MRTSKARRLVMLVALCLPLGARAQAPASAAKKLFTYEVVSVKPNNSGSGTMKFGFRPDGYIATNVPLKFIVRLAFDLNSESEVIGMPGWASTQRFDIDARMDADTAAAFKALSPKDADVRGQEMLRQILAERFGLKVHHQQKPATLYALTIGKSGSKLKEADPNDTYPSGLKGRDGVARPGMMRFGPGYFKGQATTLDQLIAVLSNQVDTTVVDKTGLVGKYDIDLKWTPEGQAAGDAGDAPTSIFAAVQEQLGLKLEAFKGTIDTVVVDHVEQPSAN